MSSDLKQQLDSMTIGQWQARQIIKTAHILSVFVDSTPEDKLRWRPATGEDSKTRSILEQVGECIFANRRFRSFFSGLEASAPPAQWDSFESTTDATTQLKESARDLAELIAKMDSAALAQEYVTHRGSMPGALAIQFPLRNMTYHMGQINMIQLLYGDTEFHIDQEFTTF